MPLEWLLQHPEPDTRDPAVRGSYGGTECRSGGRDVPPLVSWPAQLSGSTLVWGMNAPHAARSSHLWAAAPNPFHIVNKA
jgi:hypothetical protein